MVFSSDKCFQIGNILIVRMIIFVTVAVLSCNSLGKRSRPEWGMVQGRNEIGSYRPIKSFHNMCRDY